MSRMMKGSVVHLEGRLSPKGGYNLGGSKAPYAREGYYSDLKNNMYAEYRKTLYSDIILRQIAGCLEALPDLEFHLGEYLKTHYPQLDEWEVAKWIKKSSLLSKISDRIVSDYLNNPKGVEES